MNSHRAVAFSFRRDSSIAIWIFANRVDAMHGMFHPSACPNEETGRILSEPSSLELP
jgi:hypothetical protein